MITNDPPDLGHVILVNERDEEIGSMEKLEVHQRGLLHRAFSIFIFNRSGEVLLQQRADHKYHSAGLWANACCSHPYPGEDTMGAAHRRLFEELGFETELEKVFEFTYHTKFDNGLFENEFDHVFAGEYDGPILFNTTEVKAVEYVPMTVVSTLLKDVPDQFTIWYQLAFPVILEWHKRKYAGKDPSAGAGLTGPDPFA